MSNMFCYQCQETAKNEGCSVRGVCGKQPDTAILQDLLVYITKGISFWGEKAVEKNMAIDKEGLFIFQALFATITNANFDDSRFVLLIKDAISHRDALRAKVEDTNTAEELPDCATWTADTLGAFLAKGALVGVNATENEDIRSLREVIIYGVKGLCAYGAHAAMLGYEDSNMYAFTMKALAATTRDLSVDELVALVLETGEKGVTTMALLDQANTSTYGNPELSEVNLGVRDRPGILVSGHDLRDIEELLKQTEGTGVDVYTHSEMLPTHYYPSLKKYDHLVGNYGSAWWNQSKEFASFNGPILMTTNCITPVKEEYKDRFFTTGMAGWPDTKHIAERADGGEKDFSEIIAKAKTCPPPTELETGTIVGGFAHAQVMALADKVIEAVKSGAVKRFIVMGGCDGRSPSRSYFTDVAEALPENTIILTAGCAKYRYNKLNLGDIGGIPRVLDAGQCNDCYSLAVIALKLQEAFGLEDINELPVSFDIAWYEQKAVIVLLALLSLGVKGIRLGPTLPAFLSPTVVQVLVDNFDIKPTSDVVSDVEAMMAGQ